MDPVTVGLVQVLVLLALIGVGMPVAYALGIGVLGMILLTGEAGKALYIASSVFEALDSIELVAVPMFIFMGSIIAASPAGADIYRALHRLIPVRGGLGISTIGGCAIFAALSGSSPATAAAIGSAGVPEMLARGYPPRLATGIIVAGGTLGILIPPSIVLLFYGIVTETSVGRLFIAGIVPGLVLAAMFAVYIFVAMRRHAATEADARIDDAAGGGATFLRVLPFLAVIVFIMVALYGGWATVSELAALGAVLSMLLVAVIYRITSWRTWRDLLLKTVRETAMVMLIAAFSYYLGQFLAFHNTLSVVTEGLLHLSDSRWVTLFCLWLVMLVMGCFLPPFAIVVIVAPLFLPFVVKAGFDPIWFGVFVTINMEMGLITPPIGVNLFVVKAIAPQVKLRDILMGSLPFLAILIAASLLLCLVPELATGLPDLLMGRGR
ncbi:MAG: TRAP transporter large permease [Rhodospirillaceae bacterium]|nr:TRAP transporter large permease [Rhodospirillaceae bacterium]